MTPVPTPAVPRATVQATARTSAQSPAAAKPAGHAWTQPIPAPGSFRVEVARTAAELSRHVDAWGALSRAAIEPNVFLEPWQLLPAIEAFGAGKRSLFLMVIRAPVHPERGDCMVGFLALEQEDRLRGLPTRLVRTWQHPHLVLGTPLLDRRYAVEAWTALLGWLTDHPKEASVLELTLLLTEGPSHHALLEILRQRRLPWLTVDQFTRAALDVRRDGDDGPEGSLSSGARKELRRQRRRLAEQGRLELRVLAADEEPAPWIEAFLELEARGWKGRAGTAFVQSDSESAYFRRICRDGHARGQLQMLALELDGQPIAMKCNFSSGRQMFCLKIAFDEGFSQYSPGVQLELDNISAFRCQRIIDKMDSCAIAEHGMINRLWSGRRSVADVLISTGRRKGNFALALFAALRGLKQTVRLPRARTGAPET